MQSTRRARKEHAARTRHSDRGARRAEMCSGKRDTHGAAAASKRHGGGRAADLSATAGQGEGRRGSSAGKGRAGGDDAARPCVQARAVWELGRPWASELSCAITCQVLSTLGRARLPAGLGACDTQSEGSSQHRRGSQPSTPTRRAPCCPVIDSPALAPCGPSDPITCSRESLLWPPLPTVHGFVLLAQSLPRLQRLSLCH